MNVKNVRWIHPVIAAAFAAFFFCCTGFGLKTRLGYDDVMNITFAWAPPWTSLCFSLLTPFTSFYRPTGSAVYRVLFEIFGLSALPFRICVYTLLLLNVFLVHRLAARLCRSEEIGAMSALICIYHGRLSAIYLNNGTLYDVLCGTLTLLTLLYYTRIRAGGGVLGVRQWLIFIILFVLALNAKEMAAAIPLVITSYELIFHYPTKTISRSSVIPIAGQFSPAIVSAVVMAATFAKMGPGSVMHATPPYELTLTIAQFGEHWRRLIADLLYAREQQFTVLSLLKFCLIIAAIVAGIGKKHLLFFASFAFLAPLPVIFIPFRGFFVMYLPMVGWAAMLGIVIVEGRDWILRLLRKPGPLRSGALRPDRVLLFTVVGFLLAWIPRHDTLSPRTPHDSGQDVIAGMTEDILDLNEPLPRGARVLFLHDRFPDDAWGTVMLSRLIYRDRDLWADRPTMMTAPPNELSYDRVFDYSGGRLFVRRRRPATSREQTLNYPVSGKLLKMQVSR